jgi:hypothetical protein
VRPLPADEHQRPFGPAGQVKQVSDLADLPVRSLRLDLVVGGVRAGIPRAQLAAKGLTGLIAMGQHRVKAEVALERAAALSLSEWMVTSVASRSMSSRAEAPASFHARGRATVCAARSRSRSSAAVAIRSITRNAVELDVTGPNRVR